MTPHVIFCDLNHAVAAHLDRAFGDVAEVAVVQADIRSVLARPADALIEEPIDAVVSPANSYGLMDGGVDGALTEFFGPRLQAAVQAEILRCWAGEQPVGTCLTVAIPPRRGYDEKGDWRCRCGHHRLEHHHWHNPEPIPRPWPCNSCDCADFDDQPPVQWLLHAPTMRVPQVIAGTDNVRLAFRAVLLAALRGGTLKTTEAASDPTRPHDHFYNAARVVDLPCPIRTVLCPGMGTATGGVAPSVAASQMRLAWREVIEEPPSALDWQVVGTRESLRAETVEL